MTTAVHAVVEGRVQGVGYRAWTRREALARGLRGWVRNRRDGAVEAVFAGDAAAIDAMLPALREGPPSSRVSGVVTTPWSEPVDDGFAVRDTV